MVTIGKYLLCKRQKENRSFIDMDRIQNENQWDDEDVSASNADMVPAEEPEEYYEEEYEEEPVRAAGWRVLAIIFMLLGVGSSPKSSRYAASSKAKRRPAEPVTSLRQSMPR